ncbi:MAG: GGDEF domain-containing protein [Spirochaetales bacterium]|nr:GGDEF domain-containing protein [Spirochaetales bacterium]
MRSLLKPLQSLTGYSKATDAKLITSYHVNFLGMALVGFYLVLYLFTNPALPVIAISLLSLIAQGSVIFILKKSRRVKGGIILFLSYLFTIISYTFFLFPADADLSLFFIILIPVSFLLFDMNSKEERRLIVFLSGLTIFLYLLSVLYAPLMITVLPPPITTVLRLLSSGTVMALFFFFFFFYTSNLTTTKQNLDRMKETDELTNLYNRQRLFDEGQTFFKTGQIRDFPFIFLLFDIDDFKMVNDTYGYPAGDSILVQMSNLISRRIRQDDLFCRYGGQEFALIFKNTSHDNSDAISRNIGEAVAKHHFFLPRNKSINLTISQGVVSNSRYFASFEAMVQAAEQAHRSAKDRGPNTINIVLNETAS